MLDIVRRMDAASTDATLAPTSPILPTTASSTELEPSVAPRELLLNPVVGPEAITGSTRMKGGTATKLLLEAAAVLAIGQVEAPREQALNSAFAARWLRRYLRRQCIAMECAYSNPAALAHASWQAGQALAHASWQAGQALRAGGRVLYVAEGTAGLLGVIDSSECPPTYGAAAKDVWCCWTEPAAEVACGFATADLQSPSSLPLVAEPA